MEQEKSNTNSPVLCRAGCGFYGSSSMEGMCSKCYKETLNRKMQPPPATTTSSTTQTPTPALHIIHDSPSSPSSSNSNVTASFHDLSQASSPMPIPHLSHSVPAFSMAHHMAKPSSSASLMSGASSESMMSISPSASSLPDSLDPSSPLGDSAKKKNRCAECNKRVGLTAGFECRCGSMYCSIHRYSDMHKCSFDYKTMGAEEIRKNNPTIRAEKVQKF